MAVIKVQKIPQKKTDPLDLIAQFCYHFPQYTFNQARKLPFVRIKHMLRMANVEQAKYLLLMVRVVSAPHSKDGGKSIIQDLNAIINE